MINKRIQKLTWLLAATFMVAVGHAQAKQDKVVFQLKAPSEVQAGSAFQVVFELNRDGENFEGPDFKGFDVLGGPGFSRSAMAVVTNGKRAQEVSSTFTYALLASRTGKMEIGPARITVGKTVYRTKPVTITVKGSAGAAQGHAAGAGSAQNPQSSSDDGGDLFILNIVTNASPYKGEVVVLTQKLYTRLAINNIGRVKLPSFNGFWTESIDIGNYEIVQEKYQGKLYNTLVISRIVLIPQRSGRMVIDPSTVMIQRVIERTVNRPLFGGVVQQRVRDYAEHEIKSSNLVLDVRELPAKDQPASFRGTVGQVSFDVQLSSDQTEVGEPVELLVRIAGSGNLKLLDKPQIQLPPGLELFEPEVGGRVTVSMAGMSGNRTYKYLVIPRDTGNFTLQGIEFSYFNPETGGYVQVVAPALKLVVSGGQGKQGYRTANMTKEDVRYFGKDIRYIRSDYRTPILYHLKPGSWGHLLLLTFPLLLLMVWILRYRKRVKMIANRDKLRQSKAEQAARERIREAAAALRQNNDKAFFQHHLDTLWGYASDKFNLQPAELTRGRLEESFASRGVGRDLIVRYIALIDECEFSRYSPISHTSIMEKVHQDVSSLITDLEKKI